MFVKLLGLMDIFSAVIILAYALVPHHFIAFAALYLMFKGVGFLALGDILSAFDILIGVYIVLLSFGLHISFLSSFSVVVLFVKGVLSLI